MHPLDNGRWHCPPFDDKGSLNPGENHENMLLNLSTNAFLSMQNHSSFITSEMFTF